MWIGIFIYRVLHICSTGQTQRIASILYEYDVFVCDSVFENSHLRAWELMNAIFTDCLL
jgi:hypothetical protein